MPELPEVEIIRTGLDKEIKNKTVSGIILKNSGLKLKLEEEQLKELAGKVVNATYRRGKWPALVFDSGYLWLHLGMTGQLIYSKTENNDSHIHLIIKFTDGTYLYYRDPRKFGTIAWTSNATPPAKNLGVEPLSSDFTFETIKTGLSKKSKSIKTVLLDGDVVCGIGNIYAAEILFASKINPFKSAKTISDRQIKDLMENTKKILTNAIKLGGSTISDYVTVSGSPGNAQSMHRVYNKKICSVCKNKISADTQGGRTTFWCNICQKD